MIKTEGSRRSGLPIGKTTQNLATVWFESAFAGQTALCTVE
jgi:hypothetical protein